jgi:hypothetical protein
MLLSPLPQLLDTPDGTCNAEMLSTDEDPQFGQAGLTFVKQQFLKRTGIEYTDLVELLKTQFINPSFPQGKALTILESIRFSYRFLQTLVTNSDDPKIRFAKLIDFLETYQPLVPLINAILHPDPCHQEKFDVCAETQDLRQWVCCYFDRIGKLIVLEAGEGPQLPIEGDLYKLVYSAAFVPPELIGTLRKDGTIIDKKGVLIGSVTITGEVVGTNNQPFLNSFDGTGLLIGNPTDGFFGEILDRNGVDIIIDFDKNEEQVNWLSARDTCDLDKVRLIHLDGSSLTVPEYDRMHRFIRLWRKMGWTIDETDKALTGLGAYPGTATTPGDCHYVDFGDFSLVGGEINRGCDVRRSQTDDGCCPDTAQVYDEITPDFLHQLVAVRKLLDLTGLPLIKLLAFWADISTVGEQSLYSRLLLTHNLLGIDKVFQADADGNYLTQSATITDHVPVLMAALKLKADDITTIMGFRQLGDSLTLRNVTVLYRHSLLAKLLHVRVTELVEVIRLFGDPFTGAD